MGTETKLKNWYDELNKFEDSIPCPHCLHPVQLVNYVDPSEPFCTAFQCRNESCYAFSEWILLENYYKEIRRVYDRINEGYKYLVKVRTFAIRILDLDKRKAKKFCNNCNTEIEKGEIHIPVNRIVRGKEQKFCEVRIRRIKN